LLEQYVHTKPGAVVWNAALSNKLFIKCSDSWVFCTQLAVSPFGNKTVAELVPLMFKAQAAKVAKNDVKFNFL